MGGRSLHPVLYCGLLHGLLVEDLNQLGRRNLTRDQRDALIKRLAAAGVRQKEIAEKVGLAQPAISKIVNGDIPKEYAPAFTTPDLTVTAKLKDEIEALRRTAEAIPFTLSPSAVPLHNGLHGPSFPRQHRYHPGTN